MKGNRKKTLVLAGAIFILLVGVFVNYKAANNVEQNGSEAMASEKNYPTPQEVTQQAKELQQPLDGDFILGDESAPVTVLEYASLSCPHCASFYNSAFDQLKTKYIDTKKVRLIYRDFPLNQPALAGAAISLCYGRDNDNSAEKYYSFVKALYKTQESWAFTDQFIEKLKSIAKLSGMSGERFDACLDDQELQKSVLEGRMQASKALEIKSTPTFIINGYTINGFKDFEEMQKVIDSKLKK